MRKIALASLFVVGLTVAAPANARNWVSVSTGRWVDRDSIRREGVIAYFTSTVWFDGVPPDDGGVLSKAYNCASNLLYSAQLGPGDPRGMVLDPAEAAPYRDLLCR